MRIDVFNAVGGAAFFEGLVRSWRADGDVVRTFAAVDDGTYRSARGPWARARLRCRMYGGFAWRCWTAGRATDVDVRLVTTNPFFAPALVLRSGRGGPPVPAINLVYDLFPDAALLAGSMREDSWLARRAAAWTRQAFRESAATVFLGERLRAHAEAAHGPARRAVVIPVGADATPFEDTPPRPPAPGEPVRLLYAGVMGRMHDTATLVRLWAERPPCPGLEWIFHASGAGYGALRRAAGHPEAVRWADPLDGTAWVAALRRCPVALVTMAPGAERVVMPSKTYSALVAGQAVLAVCPADSDLADLVRRHGCGWVVEPGDVGGLAGVLDEIRMDRDLLQERRERAYAAGHRLYGARPVAALWRELFHDLVHPPRATVRLPNNDEAIF